LRLLHHVRAQLDGVTQAHSTIPVPPGQSVPGYRVTLVFLGIAFTLTTLYIGAELALTLGLAVGMRAILIGSLILCAMSVPAAMIGAQTRLSTYMIVSRVFGRVGARLVNLILVLVLIGWYAVTAELFGRTGYLTVRNYFSSSPPEWLFTVGGSVLTIVTTTFGFRAVERLSQLIAPLLVALTGYVAYRALERVPWAALLAVQGTKVDLSTGISAVIGGTVVGVVLMPDMTRYSRSIADCTLISVVGNGFGTSIALILAMLPAVAFHEMDPMKYMADLGLVGIAFVTLILSTWTINTINLYSTGLVTSTVLRNTPYSRIVLGCGIVGTVVAVIGIADRLIGFLVVLGLIVPPIASVYLTDFFVLGRRDYSSNLDERQHGVTNINGILACAAGAAVGCFTYYTHAAITGVPTIESFVSAAVVYAVAELWRGRTMDPGISVE